ncbi:hypothetical protein AB0J35_20675 [Nonomuraea angiospora]|uniref:hypothetical protein n=1 Tax=Nonomuraea angiospora TaxID=46172 RepID=UPI0034281DE8
MALPSIYEGLEEKIPYSLDDLHGPAEGVVALPTHLAWSGLTEFDLSKPGPGYRHAWEKKLSMPCA